MNEKSDEPRPRGRGAWLIAFVLICVLVIYPLSIGPAYALLDYTGNPEALSMAPGIVYMPLILICQVTGITQPLSDYIEWWEELTM
jgi:hypothetical protein